MSQRRPRQVKIDPPPSDQYPVLARGPPPESLDFAVVGIGASAGGLDACRKFISALPIDNDMAFILVQHLDPTHESMMVDLLGGHASMSVLQATDGILIERKHLYIIPPGTYLSVADGTLHLTKPQARHGARLPFDFLLNSLAEAYGSRAACVILSGTGADGALGLKKVKAKGGFVIAQDPEEAGFGGMPRSAMMTGMVDLVLPVSKIPDALIEHNKKRASSIANSDTAPTFEQDDWLSKIIDLLKQNTPHDFTLYKKGTLQRRIERRMVMVGIEMDGMARYFEMLEHDPTEMDLLAKDLLINVTGFFRDRQVFDYLAEKIIPTLVGSHADDYSLRIWIAGCSTGEETYSLAMLFREEIKAAKRDVKLQLFASDVDPDAVAFAREGSYPITIEASISPERLTRFFSKEEGGYRILPELRAAVVFTVQDVLADPPFSRLDLVSCRNLLIYLNPEAQAKVISLFHFALREGGILLLGNAETIGSSDNRFEVVSKSERLYRHIARSRPGELSFMLNPNDSLRASVRPGQGQGVSRQANLAELCKRFVMETYAPATVLINHKHECLYSFGPTDRYLRLAPGAPTYDVLAMARQGMRTKLRSAIEQARQSNTRVVVTGAKANRDNIPCSFSIAVQPVSAEGEELLLICFIDEPENSNERALFASPADIPRIAALERELEATSAELQGAIRNLEISSEEQKAINDEALSVNEEYQSTNEELLTSKEELQSLNEELTALNSQLQETLERQRTTSNDLKNILYSTNVATLFLDTNLNIRFFTPATKSLFNVILSDVGRPLADLSSLTADATLLTDACAVLQGLSPLDKEIEATAGAWYIRRIMPYRIQENRTAGVVITFIENTERRRVAEALETAKRQAELATATKSRFLAIASHDLRQPLQTLALLQSLLLNSVEGEKAKKLLGRLDDALGAMSGMLNTLLDINQIEAGTVHVNKVTFPINDLFGQLRSEFTYLADAQGLGFHVVDCGLLIHTDRQLLEQMIRNLLSNALKYTKHGKLLLGCRRHEGTARIEVWDTGIGIPPNELQTIFEEYHQLDNPARLRSLGLGLGLSIVRRVGELLGHKVAVRSQLGQGSVFSIDVTLEGNDTTSKLKHFRRANDDAIAEEIAHTGTILIVEDDSDMCSLLEDLLQNIGYSVVTAADGTAAMQCMSEKAIKPDLILTDYNLPKGMNGIEVAAKLREKLKEEIPIIILTGDISTETLRNIARQDWVQLNKPVRFKELKRAIERLLSKPRSIAPLPFQPVQAGELSENPVVFVVDDDAGVSESIRAVLEDQGFIVETFLSCEAFLKAYHSGRNGCLLIDAYLPGMNGLDLLQRLKDLGERLPAIMITGNSDVAVAIQAMKAGALDFIEKPFSRKVLLSRINMVLDHGKNASKHSAWREDAKARLGSLTRRQREIMDRILTGHPNKNIAMDLGISQRTVENHRASIMQKTGSKSLPALARLAFAADAKDADDIP
jgi:two-component system CheB/CheR fusion protein